MATATDTDGKTGGDGDGSGSLLLPRLMVAAAGCCWALGGVMVPLVEDADAWQIVFWRSLGVAAVIYGSVLVMRRGRLLPAIRETGLDGIVAGLCLAVTFVLFVTALRETAVANVLFMLGVAPILAALMGRIILGETVRHGTWLAMAIALAGIVVMVADGFLSDRIFGTLAAAAAACGFALFSVFLRKGRDRDMMPAIGHAGLFAAAGCGLVILLEIGGGTGSVAIGPVDLALCLGMAVVQIGLGFAVYTPGARRLPAAECVLLSLTELAVGPLLAWLFLAQTPTAATFVGGALIVCAVAYQALSGARRRRAPPGLA